MGCKRKDTTARHGPATPRQRPTLVPFAIPLAVVTAVALAGIGCSVEKNYKLLSFFFDGVPAPKTAEEIAAETKLISGVASVSAVSAHPAYVERRCGDCHGGSAQFGFFSQGFTGLDARVCLKCHAQTIAAEPRLHGPVAAGACLWCHQPHESPYQSLLVKPSPDVCLRCHEFQADAEPTPGHEQPPVDCLTCHRPHGGSNRYFLRARGPEAAPAGPPQESAPVPAPGPAEP